MRKFVQSVLVVLMSMMTSAVLAQQLPDPGFEDWSGKQFNGAAQPKYWNFSNVDQLGQKFNFAHETTGRSGKALLIQDQFVGVNILGANVGATSPGYVSLGHPWAYVSSLTALDDATAGTYGGISFTHRPDSMVVWIKRYYDSSVTNPAGDHTSDEQFHLLYYAWSGTSQGTSYKAKDLSCTNLSSAAPDYCVDEESDIRLATNGNECGTPKVQAKQIAEGWYHEAKKYQNWTRMVVPIFYLNDDTPQKCNVILSAGRYPDFRANNGQNAGSSLVVDDISLVYSSKIQKLYIGGKEWKGFDPNNTGIQVYALGAGATAIPAIEALRGAGKLTNSKNATTNFPGRRLNSTECRIVNGQVDGEPTTLTVTAEDGSSTTVYRIKFVSQTSNNARLADIRVNGQTISGFNAYLTNYNVALPYGTTEVPVVEATAQDATAQVVITQPTSTTGTATIVVNASDGTTTMTYRLSFSVAAMTDVTLKNIFVDGNPLPGYVPTKSNYTVSLPLGTTAAPAITWQSAYADGVQTVTLLGNSLENGAQIQVTIPNTTLSKTYKLTYKIEASSYSLLSGIALDGEALEGFAPEKTAYTITLPMGATSLPAITWTQGDPYQTVRMTEGGVEGITRIEVTAASGATTTYRLTFKTEKSSNNALAGIALDGEALEGFDPETLSYQITLPAGTTALPTVSFTTGDSYQTVAQTVNQTLMTVRLTVTAGDGSTRVYTLAFEVEKSANALLQMIYLNGQELAGFQQEQLDYALVWTEATMPQVSVLGNEGQSVAISIPASYGLVRIVVTPEEGSPNTYTVRLNSPDEVALPAFPTDSFTRSNEARLAALYINGQLYEAFNAETYNYTYPLAAHTYQVPAMMPVASKAGQTITIEYGAVNRPTVIRVLAPDKQTTKTYTVLFTAPQSSNTTLAGVEIEGISFEFDPATHTYTGLHVPFEQTVSPTITVERSEAEQSLVITEAPIGLPSTVEVTAEDGSKAVYSFSYERGLPTLPNELLSIIIEGAGGLDLSQGTEFSIELPFGTDSLKFTDIIKNYPEQRLTIVNGGPHGTTTVTVHSLNPADADKTYTLHSRVSQVDSAMLTDLQLDGVTIPYFQPNVYSYVVSLDDNDLPEISWTAKEGAAVALTDSTYKYIRLTSTNGAFTHTYLVTFFYANDLSFDLDFENWDAAHNDDANKDGSVPHGWYAPINGVTSGSKGSYDPSPCSAASSAYKTSGNNSAQLKTSFLYTSTEAIPGFLSLSEPTVSVGAYLVVSHIGSTLSYGDPRQFRNTPDQVQLDYRLESTQKVTGWRFLYDANGDKQINYSQNFSAFTANQWNTFSQNITYAAGYMPSTLDIRISAAQTDDLNTYYIGDLINESKRHLSTMYFDNLRLNYNSELTALYANGRKGLKSANNFTVTLTDAETVGIPELTFTHKVSDQMPVIMNWSEEVNNVRTASIRIYGEDTQSYTDYTLKVTRPKSKNTNCVCKVNGYDLTVLQGSPYQTVAVTKNDTAYVVTVTAESGAQKVYYAAWHPEEAVVGGTAVQTVVPADHIPGQSTGRLSDLEEEPVLNFKREYALDSVSMITTDSCHMITVYGTTHDSTYIVPLHPSNNALLASMNMNNAPVPGFYEETFDYVISLVSLDDFSATPQDPDAEVQYTFVPIDDANTAVFVQVTAPDGVTQHRYTVLVRMHALATEAYLVSITANETMLSGFASNQYDYTINLPAGSAIPQMASVACEGATVDLQTVMNGSSAVVSFTVTSEDGLTQHTYTVNVHVLPSENCLLTGLYVGDDAVEGFASDQLNYAIELPCGTTSLPEIDYIKADRTSTVQVDTVGTDVTVTVTAEDGVHQTVYTIHFTIAKSTNAGLQSISLDGEALESFFTDEFAYAIQLPYGATKPVITAVPTDSKADVQIQGDTITVTAEDGVHTSTYILTFTYAPSTNALLQSIDLNGVQQSGFAPDEYVYTNGVSFGSPIPQVTWVVGDEQQKVDTVWTSETQLTITVTAGDGIATAEYTLTFEFVLSSDWHLTDLQVNGTTISGFQSDSVAYKIEYPVGTPESALMGTEDIRVVTAEGTATVTIEKDEYNTITIFITAPDGTVGVYTIEQTILLSDEARLSMIWLGEQEVRAFQSDSLTYVITLVPGSVVPEITAQTMDTLATWELGMETETENGKRVEVYSEAQDGTQLIYVLEFVYANWIASSVVDEDDYLFFYVGNGQYKAVTIGIGIQFAVYDAGGHLLQIGELPVADPADVYVTVDPESGNQILDQADPGAEGIYFTPEVGKTYFYVFFDSKTKRIAKGGKFEFNH